MKARWASSLLALLIFLGLITSLTPVHAQTITVSTPIYSSNVLLGKDVEVTFTVSWSGVPSNYAILAGVAASSSGHWVDGSMVSESSPGICKANTEYHWADCSILSPSSDGYISVVFSVDTSQAHIGQQYSYMAAAEIVYSCSSGICLDMYDASPTFTVNIVDTVTLKVDAPSQVSITLDGVQQETGTFTLQLSPGTHVISTLDIVPIDSTSRLKFDFWSDGSTQLTKTFDLESDTEITATYLTQYYLSSTEDSTLESNWYNSGTVVQFSVNQTELWNKYRLFTGGFDGWYSNGQLISTSPTNSLAIYGPVTLTAKWNDLPPIIAPIVAVAACIVVVVVIVGGYKRSKLKSRLTDLTNSAVLNFLQKKDRQQDKIWRKMALLDPSYSDKMSRFLTEGFSNLEKQEFAKAYKHFQSALRIDPKVDGLELLLGLSAYNLGNLDEAISRVDKLDLVSLQPDQSLSIPLAWYWYHKAIETAEAGELAKAEELLQRALKEEPNNTQILRGLVNVFKAQGNFAKALEWNRKIKEITPS